MFQSLEVEISFFAHFKAQRTKFDNEKKIYFGVTGLADMLVKF